MSTVWLQWAQRLQAIAQTGLTYAPAGYDTDRYSDVRRIAAEMMAELTRTEAPVEAILECFQRDLGYATPKVDVRGVVFQDDRLLLVKEREDGRWTLPGGWADIGDTPSVAAVREVREESGYEVVARKLLAVYDRNLHAHPPFPFHAYKMFFLCELVGGTAAVSNETEGVGFFDEDQIPPLSLTRVMPSQIRHLFEHHRHPDWPTSFD